MVIYPVVVPRKHYAGRKANIQQKVAEQNGIASDIERYINEQIERQEEEIHVYMYYQIAQETGYDVKTVSDILFGVDCGSNGFTVRKPK